MAATSTSSRPLFWIHLTTMPLLKMKQKNLERFQLRFKRSKRSTMRKERRLTRNRKNLNKSGRKLNNAHSKRLLLKVQPLKWNKNCKLFKIALMILMLEFKRSNSLKVHTITCSIEWSKTFFLKKSSLLKMIHHWRTNKLY